MTLSTLSWMISWSRRRKPFLMAVSIDSGVGMVRVGSVRADLYVALSSRATKLIRT